jgi:hypothetical protein
MTELMRRTADALITLTRATGESCRHPITFCRELWADELFLLWFAFVCCVLLVGGTVSR